MSIQGRKSRRIKRNRYGFFTWTVHPLRGGGTGLVFRGPQGLNETKISYALKFGFVASNNEAEYKALIAGLKLAKDVGVERIEIFQIPC